MKKFLLAIALLFIPVGVYAQQTGGEYVSSITDEDIVIADDSDSNPRYIGANPDNYIYYNNELWRIIGVFNGKLKIVRYESLGKYSYDTSEAGINNGSGTNEWSQSKLMQELNSDYLDTTLTENPKWYSLFKLEKILEFDRSKVIKNDAQKFIEENTVWHYGTVNFDGNQIYGDTSTQMNPINFYDREKGNIIPKYCPNPGYSNCNDTVERTTSWVGKVGLPSISDIFNTVGNSQGISREQCLSTNHNSWKSTGCKAQAWLINNEIAYWTMSPKAAEDNGYQVYTIVTYSSVLQSMHAYMREHVFPTIYLKDNTYFTEGRGTDTEPYKIDLMYRVTFDTDGGSTVDTQEYFGDDEVYKAVKPANPTKENYTFLGWFTENGEEYNFDNQLTGIVNLKAKWSYNYEIIEGKDQTFENKDIVIKCNGPINDLQSIKDGKNIIDSSNYTVEEGSTILTLKKEYLSTLSSGVHNITFVYSDGSATTTLTIKEKTSNTEKLVNPKTGDNIMLYISMLGLSIIGLSSIGIYTKKKIFN